MTETEFTTIAAALRRLAHDRAKGFVDGDEAEDIAQDTMLRLWTLRSELTTRQHAEALAALIAKRISIDRARKKRGISLEESHSVIADTASSSPDRTLEERQNEQWLSEKMKCLPGREYQVLRLRQTERRSTADIAAILGITEGSVEVLLSRARHKLLAQIKRRK